MYEYKCNGVSPRAHSGRFSKGLGAFSQVISNPLSCPVLGVGASLPRGALVLSCACSSAFTTAP